MWNIFLGNIRNSLIKETCLTINMLVFENFLFIVAFIWEFLLLKFRLFIHMVMDVVLLSAILSILFGGGN